MRAEERSDRRGTPPGKGAPAQGAGLRLASSPERGPGRCAGVQAGEQRFERAVQGNWWDEGV